MFFFFFTKKNPLSIISRIFQDCFYVRDSFCSGVTASQWHQPSKGLYNEEKNEAHCSQQEDSFLSYMVRITV